MLKHAMALKPDRLNNTTIFRGVIDKGGVNCQNETIVFPPTVVHNAPVVRPLDEQVEMFVNRLVTVTNSIDDPVIKAQALAFRVKVKRAAHAALYRATVIERERINQKLLQHGMTLAAQAIGDSNG